MRKNILFCAAAALAILSSCEEWEPVYTFDYGTPGTFKEYDDASITADGATFIDIADLAARYKVGRGPVFIGDNVVIKGKLSSSDRSGNIYKSLYIQDETGGMEIKMGRTSLYNEFSEGETIYVRCEGLTIGMYGYKSGSGNGMIQIGFADPDPDSDYDTSYMDLQVLVDQHVFHGAKGAPVKPAVLTEDQLPNKESTVVTCPYLGELVTLKGLRYGNEIFALLYLDSQLDTKQPSNRIFLSGAQWGVTTWAMTKNKMASYLESGIWDEAEVGSGATKLGKVGDKEYKANNYAAIQRAAYSVSQYFKMGKTDIQIRTSGYSRFCDYEIPADVLDGSRTIDVTGILTLYQGSIQFTLIDYDSIVYSDGGAMPAILK
jgi:hypothetical protein